jgi:hypothetical protein
MHYIHRESGLIVNVKRIRHTETCEDQIGNKTEVELQSTLETDGGQPCYPVNGGIAELVVQTPICDVRIFALDPLAVFP